VNIINFNIRLPLSMAFSLLLHLLVIFLIGLFLQPPTPVLKQIETLEVRLSPTISPKARHQEKLAVLTSKAPVPFKIEQADKKIQETPSPISNAEIEPPSPPSNEIRGIAMPGAIALPWQGQTNSINSPFHPPPSQQNVARIYYQRAMEAQTKLQSEQQAQLIIQQLHQLLAKKLAVDPVATGKCIFAENDDGTNLRLSCGTSALYEVLYKEQNTIASMFIALRRLGHEFSGFSAETISDKLQIKLINKDSESN
jgi:hypothetical protein